MTKQAMNDVIRRAIGDASFRSELATSPAKALAGYQLTDVERTAIASRDSARLTSLGVDQRLNKAFGLGVLGDASKQGIVGDPASLDARVLTDETSAARRLRFVEQDLAVTGAAASVEPGSGDIVGTVSIDEGSISGGWPAALGEDSAPDLNTAAADELEGVSGTMAIDEGSISGQSTHMRLVEQDLDTSGTSTTDDVQPTE